MSVFVVKFCLFFLVLFTIHTFPLLSTFVDGQCLLRQVVTWSSILRPILSLSKPYNCTCSYTYAHIKELLLFQQYHIHIYMYTNANKAIRLRAHRKLTSGSHRYKLCIHGVCLFACLFSSVYESVGKQYREIRAAIVETKKEKRRRNYGRKPFFFIPTTTTTTTAAMLMAEKSCAYMFRFLLFRHICSVYNYENRHCYVVLNPTQ